MLPWQFAQSPRRAGRHLEMFVRQFDLAHPEDVTDFMNFILISRQVLFGPLQGSE
jgi:hypothetical protein